MKWMKKFTPLALACALACAPVTPAHAEPLSTVIIGMLGYALATAKAAAFKLKIDFIIKKFNEVIVPRVGTGFVKGALAGGTPTAAYAYQQHMHIETAQKAATALQEQQTKLVSSMATITEQNTTLEKSVTTLKATPFSQHVATFMKENPAASVLIGIAGMGTVYLAARQIFKPTILFMQNSAHKQDNSAQEQRN